MESKIVKYTFDRKSGVLLDKEVSNNESRTVYLDSVIDIFCKGLREYIKNKEEVARV